MGFELVVGVANLGQFAIDFSPYSSTNCNNPTGSCDSCTVVSGQFTTNTPLDAQPLYFVGAPSICNPLEAFPGANPAPSLVPAPYVTQVFTNGATNALCVMAELEFACPSAPANALGVAASPLRQFRSQQPVGGISRRHWPRRPALSDVFLQSSIGNQFHPRGHGADH